MIERGYDQRQHLTVRKVSDASIQRNHTQLKLGRKVEVVKHADLYP